MADPDYKAEAEKIVLSVANEIKKTREEISATDPKIKKWDEKDVKAYADNLMQKMKGVEKEFIAYVEAREKIHRNLKKTLNDSGIEYSTGFDWFIVAPDVGPSVPAWDEQKERTGSDKKLTDKQYKKIEDAFELTATEDAAAKRIFSSKVDGRDGKNFSSLVAEADVYVAKKIADEDRKKKEEKKEKEADKPQVMNWPSELKKAVGDLNVADVLTAAAKRTTPELPLASIKSQDKGLL